MSPYITTTHKQLSDSRHNRPQESVRLMTVLNITSLALAAALALGYLWTMNLVVSDSYAMKDLQGRLETLNEVGQKLNRDVATLRSFEDISSRIVPMGLVATETVSYQKSSSAVARSGGPVVP